MLKFLVASLISLAVGCVDSTDDPIRYPPGNVAPCDVTYDETGESDPIVWHEAGRYEEDGPYPVWNTAPAKECRNNPTISEGDLAGKELYITYPAGTVPTESGVGTIGTGPFPVIVFAHANNDRVCNIFEKYFSLHDHWASYGFVVVAVDGTDTNCKRGSRENLQLRSDAQVGALEEVRRLNEDPSSFLYQKLDMERFVFAGHSRGGGASHVSAEVYPDEVLGVINLQGVDLTSFGFGAARLSDYPAIAFTAGNDVDVNYPYNEPMEDQFGGPYTWVNINGAIHAYTADTAPLEPDDEPDITRQQQHDITEYYTTAFLHAVAGLEGDWPRDAASEILHSFDGALVVKERMSELGVNMRWRSPETSLMIDTFERDQLTTNLLGGAKEFTGLVAEQNATYRPNENPVSGSYSKAYSLHLKAENSGTYTTWMSEDQMAIDVSTDWALEARTKAPDQGDMATLEVVIVATDGEYRFSIADYSGPTALSNRFTQLHIPLSEISTAPMTSIRAIRLEASGGEIFLDDLRFTP